MRRTWQGEEQGEEKKGVERENRKEIKEKREEDEVERKGL